jgi:class 3 adenylate cyclase
MAVFVGDGKETTAVRVALKINWAVKNIVVAERNAFYNKDSILVLNHVVGVDTSDLYVARTGVRGSNDLVWVGRAANYAAKLSALPHNYATHITNYVWLAMDLTVTYSNSVSMWTPLTWSGFDSSRIHGSTYWWSL